MKNISIIIPLGPDEDQLSQLLDGLSILPEETEIIIVSCGNKGRQKTTFESRARWLTSAQGRAVQQNMGAKAAKGEFLWFLHADSLVSPQVFEALTASLQKKPDALHYFHLKFRPDGPRAMWLNEWGAWFRSVVLGVPFGDQGFCLSKDSFTRIGGFSEDAAFGEDHLLVWQARQAGLKVVCTGAALPTSARKYSAHGWGALTLKYQMLWLKQAAPELLKLLRFRFNNFVNPNGE